MIGVWRRVKGLREWKVDLLVVVVLVAVCVLPYVIEVPPRFAKERSDPPQLPISPQWALLLPLVASLGLLLRRRWPLRTLAWTVAIGLVHIAVTTEAGPAAGPIMVALFTVASEGLRRTWIATPITAALVMTVSLVTSPGQGFRVLSAVVWVALPPAIAEAIRNRRAYLAEVEERARKAEQTKEEEARRQVAEERIRIARELHDVLAHSMAVINIQSGVAAHVIDQRPEQARQALVHINDASDAALSELRATLDLLRQDGDPSAPTSPLPNLDQVDELFASARSAGLEVRTRITGDTSRIPPETGLVAYRVLQEALTNVLKHARARSVDVTLDIADGVASLDVRDDGIGTTGPPPYGHGRIGMRERVHAVGGTLRDGPADPGYQVSITLPVRDPA